MSLACLLLELSTSGCGGLLPAGRARSPTLECVSLSRRFDEYFVAARALGVAGLGMTVGSYATEGTAQTDLRVGAVAAGATAVAAAILERRAAVKYVDECTENHGGDRPEPDAAP